MMINIKLFLHLEFACYGEGKQKEAKELGLSSSYSCLQNFRHTFGKVENGKIIHYTFLSLLHKIWGHNVSSWK